MKARESVPAPSLVGERSEEKHEDQLVRRLAQPQEPSAQ